MRYVDWAAVIIHSRATAKGKEIGGEMIPFEIRSRECAPDEIREYAERRVSFALDRFRDIRRVVVSLDDLNGPKGGMDKFCRIVAEFGYASVVVEEAQMDWHAAIARATHRLAHKVARELKRANRATFRTLEGSRKDTSENDNRQAHGVNANQVFKSRGR